MDYLKIEQKDLIKSAGPLWNYARKCYVVRAFFYHYGFFFGVDYCNKDEIKAEKTAYALSSGMKEIPKPDIRPIVWVAFSFYRTR